MVGATPGLEALDVAWNAQADLELAMLRKIKLVLSSYDFKKYFDSFQYDFTKDMLLHCGMDPGLVHLTCHLYQNSWRTMKSGNSLSEPFQTANGFGQGDVLSLIPALVFVSWQFKVIEARHPTVTKGAYIDDRNFRGSLSEILLVDECVQEFDTLAMHEREHDKTIFLCTCEKERARVKRMTLHGRKPKSPTFTEIVGHTITVARRAV